MIIELNQNIMDSNNSRADEVRKVLVEHNLVMINIISSPGSGKTSLLEKTLGKLGKVFSLGIIEGDVNTTRDARRLESFGLPITAVNTRGACHLNSTIILKALDELPLDNLDCIIIENVGNLVCPAEFDLGEHAKIAISSVPEGDDKPQKYPMLFREAKCLVLNKIDLLPYVPFDRKVFYKDIKNLNPKLPVIETSCTTGEGVDAWIKWIKVFITENRAQS
ncbi:MAG: hydrogenase accessory protein HypB [Spirochaetes bacterium]|nr:MAG: hydrogenase accessory protein HypB [Spirochaetota bacterium]RKX75763.1 MAG: hydrogenase accessory protein HypB [Spirochaetota bacterium]RKX98286.1 MAG: hydrogenase accessory protein HypB [Spirochaetota bacterium]